MATYRFSDAEMTVLAREAREEGISVRELLRRADAAYPNEQPQTQRYGMEQ